MNKINDDDQVVTKGFFRKELKKALKGYATKNDLEKFATKKDLERFVTKDEFKKEFQIQNILINEKFEELKNEIEDKAVARHNEIFKLVDGLAGEVKDNRVFRTIVGHQISQNSQRIEKLEKKVFA